MKIDLRNARCLIKVRRKVQRATEVAWMTANRQAMRPSGERRAFEPCFPASIGVTTQHDTRPVVAAIDTWDAKCTAQGDASWLLPEVAQAVERAVKLDAADFPTLRSHRASYAAQSRPRLASA